MKKTAYVLRISYWSSDVCSSDLPPGSATATGRGVPCRGYRRSWACPGRATSGDPDARVERRVQQVGEQGQHRVAGGDHQQDRLDHPDVGALDRLPRPVTEERKSVA